jgi:ATP-binding cassette subfamily F protein 3
MLQVQNLSIVFGDRVLVENATFTLRPKDRVALVGKNGAGKSTLMKAIGNEQVLETGNISKPSDYTIGFLRQEIRAHKEKTLFEEARSAFEEAIKLEKKLHQVEHEIENFADYNDPKYYDLIEEMTEIHHRLDYLDYDNLDKNIELILMGLGFKRSDFEKAPSTFSGGWAMRIELAKILLQKPDLVMLDEPTNHLDIESILWLEAFLNKYEGAALLVSHDKSFMDNVTNKTLEIELGKLSEYKANYSKYLVLKEERKELQVAAFKNQQQEIKDIQKNIDRFRAKANKASFAQSLIKKLDRMDVLEVEDGDNSSLKFKFPDAQQSGKLVVNIKGLCKSYGDKSVLRNIDLEINKGEKIAFVGKNGMGKTTLSRIIAGELEYEKGVCEIGYNVKKGVYGQHNAENLPKDQTIFDYMDRSAVGDMRARVRNILGCFLFSGDDVDKRIKVLSGGERSRLCLAHLLLEPTNTLILDEPTNHLDLRSKAVLKDAVRDYKGTVIVVSHDRDFLEGLTERVIEFTDGGIKEHMGDINNFLENKKLEDIRQWESEKKVAEIKKANEKAAEKKPVAPILSHEEKKEIAREEKNAKKRIEEVEARIDVLEKAQKALEDKMAINASEEMYAEYQKNAKELEQVGEKWEAMQMEYEEKFVG